MTRRWGPALPLLFALMAAAVQLASPVHAQISTAPAAAAEAYGLLIDLRLGAVNIPLQEGPVAWASQTAPPDSEDPDTASVLDTGQIPAGGGAVENIGVLYSSAEATTTGTDGPVAVATATAETVLLANQGGTPLISIESLKAVSTSTCGEDPSGEGTELVNLRVSSLTDPIPTPEPNTIVAPQIFDPLGLRVVANEQHPTADGRGFVVNALHIYQLADAVVPPLFKGDIIVGHAMSTVNCPNGEGSTGDQNPILIVKEADRDTARAGDTITYTATVQNRSDEVCAVNQFIDHLPNAFEFVSTSGAFGTVGEAVARPDGGTDVIIRPEAVTIPAGGSATQTFVVTVKDDAAAGVYFNNVELLCGNLGNWVKGLDAPVEVLVDTPPTTTPTTVPVTPDGDELPQTGLGFPTMLLGGLALASAGVVGALRRRGCGSPFGG